MIKFPKCKGRKRENVSVNVMHKQDVSVENRNCLLPFLEAKKFSAANSYVNAGAREDFLQCFFLCGYCTLGPGGLGHRKPISSCFLADKFYTLKGV